MAGHEGAGLVVHPGDVGLELVALDAPLAPSADLDRVQLAVTHERVGLGGRDVQHVGDVGQGQEPIGGHSRSVCHPPGGTSRDCPQLRSPGVSDSGTMSAVEFPSPSPRRISTPRWFDLRLVLGIVLVLTAVLVGALVVSRARHTDKELAVTRDLAAGTTVQPGDVRLVDVQLPADVRDHAAYLSDPSAAVGKVLNRPLHRGELVPAAVLVAAGGAQTTVSVPFAADAAPTLSRGERIVVWLSTDRHRFDDAEPYISYEQTTSGDLLPHQQA